MDYAWSVFCPSLPTIELAEIYAQAYPRGKGPLITWVANEIDRQLKWHPLEFGEPIYELNGGGVVRSGAVRPLAVTYVVNERTHTVTIERFSALSL